MKILLPPSEGKHAPDSGAPLDLSRLSVPIPESVRKRVLDALIRVCAKDPDGAVELLKLGVRQKDDVTANTRLASAATAPASTVYTGVLYDALGLATLPPDASAYADESLLIFSGLWGVVRPADPIPAYRCAIVAKLPNLEAEHPTPLARYWRVPLAKALPAVVGDEFVLDLRSSGYAAMWKPPANHVGVRVLHERLVDGRLVRSVVSHFNKATKGRLVAELLKNAVDCADADELAVALKDLDYTVEQPESQPQRLDVVVAEV